MGQVPEIKLMMMMNNTERMILDEFKIFFRKSPRLGGIKWLRVK